MHPWIDRVLDVPRKTPKVSDDNTDAVVVTLGDGAPRKPQGERAVSLSMDDET